MFDLPRDMMNITILAMHWKRVFKGKWINKMLPSTTLCSLKPTSALSPFPNKALSELAHVKTSTWPVSWETEICLATCNSNSNSVVAWKCMNYWCIMKFLFLHPTNPGLVRQTYPCAIIRGGQSTSRNGQFHLGPPGVQIPWKSSGFPIGNHEKISPFISTNFWNPPRNAVARASLMSWLLAEFSSQQYTCEVEDVHWNSPSISNFPIQTFQYMYAQTITNIQTNKTLGTSCSVMGIRNVWIIKSSPRLVWS